MTCARRRTAVIATSDMSRARTAPAALSERRITNRLLSET
jgi:hypothetical protein